MSPFKRYTSAAGIFLFASLTFAPAFAAEHEPLLDRNLFSIGTGISNNEAGEPQNDETGFQFIVAYDLTQINLMRGVDSSAEFGFMDFGFSKKDTGIWGSYVAEGAIGEGFGWMAQLGLDIGDDSGLLVGAGLTIATSEKADFRVEYVVRDEVDSFQLNFLFHL